jgi:hypothetical protein
MIFALSPSVIKGRPGPFRILADLSLLIPTSKTSPKDFAFSKVFHMTNMQNIKAAVCKYQLLIGFELRFFCYVIYCVVSGGVISEKGFSTEN